jgi:ubiquinone/menaquinone biosynthesis C-methylase UbiE
LPSYGLSERLRQEINAAYRFRRHQGWSCRAKLRQCRELAVDDNTFDKALAINSMQVWPDATAGLTEMRRVMKPGARVAVGFTPYSGQQNQGLTQTLTAAGFTNATVAERDNWFCALARKT